MIVLEASLTSGVGCARVSGADFDGYSATADSGDPAGGAAGAERDADGAASQGGAVLSTATTRGFSITMMLLWLSSRTSCCTMPSVTMSSIFLAVMSEK